MTDAGVRILVVEDDADMRRNLCDILELDEYQVFTAGSLAEGLDQCRQPGLAAVILDCQLPDGRADQMLPRLRDLSPESEFIIVTGYAELDSALAAIRSGASDYLLKPIDPDALRAALRRTVQQRQTRQTLAKVQCRLQALFRPHLRRDSVGGRSREHR